MNFILFTLRFALFLFSFLLICPRSFFNEPGSGLDGSWNLALHMAFEKGFIFGRDFIFTYGPLGIVQTRLRVGGVGDLLLASDLFIYGNIFGLGIWALSKVRFTPVWVMIAATSYIASVAMYFMEPAIILFLLSLFYLFLYLGYGTLLLAILAAICGVFVLYVKLNLGLCAFLVLLAGFGWRLILGESFLKVAAHVAASFGVLLISAYYVPVDLPLYIRASLEIASGYNEAMALSKPEFEWLLEPALILWGLFLLFGLLNFKFIFRLTPFVFIYGGVLLSHFLLFKQSFVRADEHVYALFEYAPVLALMLLVLFQRAISAWVLAIGVLSVSSYVSWDRFWPDQPFRKIDEAKSYWASIGREEYIGEFKGKVPIPAQLPSEFTSVIGTSTVDSIPWDIASLYYNNLNYLPRPVIQSYSAYTPYLDGLSALKYASDSGPSFIIFSLDCIDGRYCWFDEMLTKLSILRRYVVRDSRGGKLLLERQSQPKLGVVEDLSDGLGTFGQPISVPPSDDPLIWTPDIRNSPFGTLEKVFFRIAEFRIKLQLEDGSKRSFAGVMPILRGGVLVDRFVGTSEDARMYFNGEREALSRIASITVSSPAGGSFNNEFSYKFSRVVFKKDP